MALVGVEAVHALHGHGEANLAAEPRGFCSVSYQNNEETPHHLLIRNLCEVTLMRKAYKLFIYHTPYYGQSDSFARTQPGYVRCEGFPGRCWVYFGMVA